MPNPGDGDHDDRVAFAAGMSSPISHVFDDPGELWRLHGVVSQPTMVLVAADGTIEKRTGALGPQGLLGRAKELAAT